MDGLPRARLQLDDVHRMMGPAPADALPLIALEAVWLWNLAEGAEAAAHCVDGCLALHYALAEYGIGSRIEAVAVRVGVDGRGAVQGERPRYNADGTFNGHTVVVVPAAGRFLDPTVQQFAGMPDSGRARLPLLARLPAQGGLGDQPFGVGRGDHVVAYLPLGEHERQAWRCAAVDLHAAAYRESGANLAANVFAMLRLEQFRARTAESPYPRLRSLLAALRDAEIVVDSRGFRFADPATGKEVWLADVP